MIHLSKMSFSYSLQETLFSDLSARIPLNQITFLTGNNGSGKSTLCRLIAGLEAKYTGSILLEEKEVRSIPTQIRFKKLTFIKQYPVDNLLGTTAVADMLFWDPRLSKSEINTILDYYQILPVKNKPLWDLSFGQMKRLSLCGLLTRQNSYWILDEPTAGLDTEAQGLFEQQLIQHAKRGCGALIVTHEMPREFPIPFIHYTLEKGVLNHVK